MLNLLQTLQNHNKRLTILIDGEHYPQVNYDSIQLIKDRYSGIISGIIFLGGKEKLIIEDLEDFYGYKVIMLSDLDVDFLKAMDILKPDLVYDLSDEPVVNHRIRMKIASFCFSRCCSYMGPDFYFEYEDKYLKFSMKSLLVIGTGKRVGKTAVSSYTAGILTENNEVVIIAMGRGGPREPQVISRSDNSLIPEALLEMSNKGLHASSDYIEDALFSGVTTIGCHRCGGGFGGRFFLSNIKEGVETAEKLKPEMIIVEGSGASVPPVKTDSSVCVVGADQKWEDIIGYMGIYRILISDLIFMTMCEEPNATEEEINFLANQIRKVKEDIKIVKSIFRPKPLYDISNKKVFLVITSKSRIEEKLKHYLEKQYNCRIVKISFNLADRQKLKKELSEFKDYDVLLTELKAAAVDMVTEFAFRNNKSINYLNNVPVIIEGEKHFDNFINEFRRGKDGRK
jgi:cyclic 2,3-diphosphoglycerate synthetase